MSMRIAVGEGRGDDPAARRVRDAVTRACEAAQAALVEPVGCDILVTCRADEAPPMSAVMARPRIVLDLSPVPPQAFIATSQRLRVQGIECIAAEPACGNPQRLYADETLGKHEHLVAILRHAWPDLRFTGGAGSSKAMASVERLLAAIAGAVAEEAMDMATSVSLDADQLRSLLAKGSGAMEALRPGGAPRTIDSCHALQDLWRAKQLGKALEHPLYFAAAASAAHRAAAASDRGRA